MKTTNSDWPDPTDWVKRLHEELAARDAVYQTEVDDLMKRNKAGAILGAVVSALMELPSFKNDGVLLPLKDVLIFFADLDRGRDHPWSAPVNFGGTNRTTTAQSELKIWIRGAFEILRSNGFEKVESYRRIATGLSASGRKGRSGGPVRWQRVREWCLEEHVPADLSVQTKLNEWWVVFMAQRGISASTPSSDNREKRQQLVGQFSDQLWSLPHLRDRSVSGASD